MAPALPLATYRLQLNKDFGFDDAAALVPYLKALGISHLYASPFLKARAGSTHGYDIVDHTTLNPEFGGEAAFIRLSDALREAELGLILDFVPNHMGVHHADNNWWLDVLEWGRQSAYANTFDIAWDLLPYRHGGVLLPVLGVPYGDALQNGEIELRYDAGKGSFSAWYYEHRFPINPQRYGEILRTIVAAADATESAAGRALLDIATDHASPRSPTYREAPDLKRRLSEVAGASDIIERCLSAYRASNGGTQTLHRLLERQSYRLAHWRIAVSGINYRRFFDINDLAGIRVEDPRVFRAVHVTVARLVAEGRLQGLRLDHIDGLRDPAQYAKRLHQLIRKNRPRDESGFHVTIEKILGEGETSPGLLGVAGTTGYEWLNVIARVLINGDGLHALDRTWRDTTGETRTYGDILEGAKNQVLDTLLASEFNVLVQQLSRIAAGHYTTRDHTTDRLRAALRLYVLLFPVYRTYVTGAGISDRDREIVSRTIATARERWTGPDPDIFDFLESVLTLDLVNDERAYSAPRIRDFAQRIQQFTSPMMAKSLEDTTFYRHHRLLALNEVGGDPMAEPISVEAFHDLMIARAANPGGLTATATHDTKRGEDARMRILALSDQPKDWADSIYEWERAVGQRTMRVGGLDAPSPGHRYMLYQSLLGAWPGLDGIDETFIDRIRNYAIKAAREGKAETSWINPNGAYEGALIAYINRLLDRDASATFLRSFDGFASRMTRIGRLNSISQTTLKFMMPGVPDIYQGTEFWDLSLVDPDNRRPVDYAARESMLKHEPDWSVLLRDANDGRIKLALMQRLLALRNRLPELFAQGAYVPLTVQGPDADHVIAFRRTRHDQGVTVAIGRHFGNGDDAHRHWQFEIEMENGRTLHDEVGASPGIRIDNNRLKNPFTTLPVAVFGETGA